MKSSLFDDQDKLSEDVLTAQNGESVFLKRLEMLNKRFPVPTGLSGEDAFNFEDVRKKESISSQVEL